MSSEILSGDSFYKLTPDDVLNGVEEAGFMPTGEFQQLNSYENRVFDVWLEKDADSNPGQQTRVIAKFYRPGRWSKLALEDEHNFLADLVSEGIHAIAPLKLRNGSTLMQHNGLFYALFPRFAGRMPQEFLPGELKQVGRTLARIHNIGSRRPARHRLRMSAEEHGWNQLEDLAPRIDPGLWPRYEKACSLILEHLDEYLDEKSFLRIHGDCHKGNLLHAGQEFFFVDFDDFLNGPAAQDFWMLLSGSEAAEKEEMISGYEELRDFPDEQLELFEPLRGLRILHYAAWISKRWSDPSFPRLFPEFGTFRYWAEEVEGLEKIAWSLE